MSEAALLDRSIKSEKEREGRGRREKERKREIKKEREVAVRDPSISFPQSIDCIH